MTSAFLNPPHGTPEYQAPIEPFAKRELLERIGSMSEEELDKLSFGVIGLDDDGRVTHYNRFESELCQVPKALALGEDFFAQIAPCTKNQLVKGRFAEGVAAGTLDVVFPYVFSYRMAPAPVLLHLFRCPRTGTNWLFVKPELESL